MGAGAGNRSDQLFTQVVRGSTLSEKVASSITQAIMDGTLAAGERMPSERDLGEQFGVSRTVVREAVRSLAASGLVEARSGRGLQVSQAGPEAVSRAMATFLQRSDSINYPLVHEVRSALEIDMAGYAAERAAPADVERLSQLNDELAKLDDEAVERAAELDVAFHHAIAQATQNQLFSVLLESIAPVLLEVRLRALGSTRLRRDAIDAHAEILKQIAAGDASEARIVMRRHLEASAAAWASDDLASKPLSAPRA